MPLHTKMLIGFLVGLFGGIAAYTLAADAPWLNALIDWVTYPAGQTGTANGWIVRRK